MRHDLGEKELELVHELREVSEVRLDREMKDKRDRDPGVGLSTDEHYDSDDEAELFVAEELPDKINEVDMSK